MVRRHYINLSNGLEALDEVRATGEGWAVLRLQSTTIERRDWRALLMVDLSADLLLHLALGVECVLHDRGTRRPLSKTCYYAVPLVRHILGRRWYGLRPDVAFMPTRHGGRGHNAVAYFDQVYDDVVGAPNPEGGVLRRRLDYFGRYANAADPCVRFVAASKSTDRDGDTAHQVSLARGIVEAQVTPSAGR